MGTCVSRPEGCVRVRRKSGDGPRKRRRRMGIRRRVSSSRKSMETIDEIPGEERGDDQPVYSNPTFQGCEFCWFFFNFYLFVLFV